MKKSILPVNSSPVECAVDTSTFRLNASQVVLQSSPFTCIDGYLPFLAWEWHVDSHWDLIKLKEQKIKQINDSFFLHRIKGTVASVEKVISDIGATAEVIEWWQQSPAGDPFTFSVNSDFSDFCIIDIDKYKKLISALNDVKPLRSSFSVSLSLTLKTYLRAHAFQCINNSIGIVGCAEFLSEIKYNPIICSVHLQSINASCKSTIDCSFFYEKNFLLGSKNNFSCYSCNSESCEINLTEHVMLGDFFGFCFSYEF